MEFINAGFGNYIAVNRILTVAAPDAAPIKRMVQDGKETGRVIDISCGRKTKSVLFTDSEYIILSALTPEKIYALLNDEKNEPLEETNP
ncbi:MAG: DUF370 domain-containing protein [Clostridiales bacterium]|nr:DUF370 domain-containing protein [Clostridiales bacterium]